MNFEKPLNVLFDCERMKYQHTGLYHFCLQLGKALVRNSNKNKEKISFYLPPSIGNIFGDEQNYVAQKSLHKLWMPSLKKFDVWHATNHDSYHNASIAKLKNVLTIHDLNFLYEHSTRKEKIKKSLNKLQQQINSADKICTISEFVKQDILKHVDTNGKNIQVIYNGCNVITASAKEPISKPTTPFLFTIGTVTAKKNFHVLPALLQNNNYTLFIGGIIVQTAYEEKIKQEAIKYNVQDRVIFTGKLSDAEKMWYMQHCTAFVFPSIAEGFGLPVIEAMSFGKPVFISTATSLPEIGGDVAYYFTSFEPIQMQQVLLKGLVDYNKNNPSEKIKKHAATFSWDEAAMQYLEVYRSLI